MVKTRQWQLAVKPTGDIKLSGADQTFKLVEVELPELKDGQLLVKTLDLSNDPAQRGWIDANAKADRMYMPPVELGAPMTARGLAIVLESKSDSFKKGDYVIGATHWAELAIVDAKETQPAPELPGLSRTHYLGALGITGLTAFYGVKEIVRTTPDDIVVVSGAAGAAGSMAVQIAKKIIGAKKVYGIAGSDEKCRWVEKLGADKCYNYKNKDWKKEFSAENANKVNVYFDNVGGDMLDFMLTQMSVNGRIAACGSISTVNNPGTGGIMNWSDIVTMRLEVKGFIVLDYLHRVQEVMDTLTQAVKDGKIFINEEMETIVPCKFEDVPNTFIKLFDGSNTGKLVTEIK